jgi:hypothetical protein
MQRHDTYTILGIAFLYVGRYGGDFLEKYGSRYSNIQVFCLLFLFFSFLGHWKGIKSQEFIMSIILYIYYELTNSKLTINAQRRNNTKCGTALANYYSIKAYEA